MSLTKSVSTTTPKRLPIMHITAALVAIAAVVAIALTAGRPANQTRADNETPLQLTHQKFLELNTTAMPVMSPTGASASDAALGRFIELNTTALPPIALANRPEPTDEFLRWNVDAFAPTFAQNSGVGVQSIQPAGPR